MHPPKAKSVLGKRTISSSPPQNNRLPPKPPLLDDEGLLSRLAHPLSHAKESPFTTNPPFQQPAPIANFSFDQSRRLHHDDRSKKYYRGPPPSYRGADLNYGFDRFTQRDESVPEHLDALLECLIHRGKDADADRARVDLITWRGIMTKLCTAYDQYTPGEGRPVGDSFELNAMMVGNILYLEEYTGPSLKAEKAKQNSNECLKKFGYYGYSFESYCTVDTAQQVTKPYAGNPPGWSGDVNTKVQWCQVVKTKLGSSRLILGGEVDCVDERENLVELKTTMKIRPGPGSTDTHRFEKKLLKFYMQSFLLGIPRIVVGFRDTRGFIVTHQDFETLAIPRMVRAGSVVGVDQEGRPKVRQDSLWEPKDSLGFGDRILTWIRETIKAEVAQDPIPPQAEALHRYPVFRVSFLQPFEEVTIRKLSEEEEMQVKDDGKSGERVGFLTKKYYEWVEHM